MQAIHLSTAIDRGSEVQRGELTINAAFLQEIKEDNRELRELLADCLAACEPAGWRRTIDPMKLTRLLGKLRDQLGMHFALEEAYGYFDDAVSVAPQISQRALELRQQHRPLFVEMCQLVDETEQLRYHEPTSVHWQDIAENFFNFHERFRQHEAAEDQLIMQMINEEIGCGD